MHKNPAWLQAESFELICQDFKISNSERKKNKIQKMLFPFCFGTVSLSPLYLKIINKLLNVTCRWEITFKRSFKLLFHFRKMHQIVAIMFNIVQMYHLATEEWDEFLYLKVELMIITLSATEYLLFETNKCNFLILIFLENRIT